MTKTKLASLILAEFKRQAAEPKRFASAREFAGDLTMTTLVGDFVLIELARRILRALPGRRLSINPRHAP
jgi:hypothetical protein